VIAAAAMRVHLKLVAVAIFIKVRCSIVAVHLIMSNSRQRY